MFYDVDIFEKYSPFTKKNIAHFRLDSGHSAPAGLLHNDVFFSGCHTSGGTCCPTDLHGDINFDHINLKKICLKFSTL